MNQGSTADEITNQNYYSILRNLARSINLALDAHEPDHTKNATPDAQTSLKELAQQITSIPNTLLSGSLVTGVSAKLIPGFSSWSQLDSLDDCVNILSALGHEEYDPQISYKQEWSHFCDILAQLQHSDKASLLNKLGAEFIDQMFAPRGQETNILDLSYAKIQEICTAASDHQEEQSCAEHILRDPISIKAQLNNNAPQTKQGWAKSVTHQLIASMQFGPNSSSIPPTQRSYNYQNHGTHPQELLFATQGTATPIPNVETIVTSAVRGLLSTPLTNFRSMVQYLATNIYHTANKWRNTGSLSASIKSRYAEIANKGWNYGVNPLFELWLDNQNLVKPASHHHQITHVYFNDLSYNTRTAEASWEQQISIKLHNLEDSHHNIVVITMPATNGLLSKTPYDDMLTYTKTQLTSLILGIINQNQETVDDKIRQYFVEDFCWSDKLKSMLATRLAFNPLNPCSLEDKLNALIQESIDTFADTNTEQLSATTCQAIYFHFFKYALTNLILEQMQPLTFNISSKHAINRSGVHSAYYNWVKSHGAMSLPELATALHIPPMIENQQPMNNNIELLKNAMSLNKFLKDAIDDLIPGWSKPLLAELDLECTEDDEEPNWLLIQKPAPETEIFYECMEDSPPDQGLTAHTEPQQEQANIAPSRHPDDPQDEEKAQRLTPQR